MLAQNKKLSEEAARLREVFDRAGEWLLTDEIEFAVQRDEIEIAAENNRLVLSCLTARGWQSWRVADWTQIGDKLVFTVTRKFGAEKAKIEFVPRVSIVELGDDVRAARVSRAREIAEIARREFSRTAKIERVGLSAAERRGRVGSFARILIANQRGKTIAVCGSVAEKTQSEKLLVHSILWLAKLEERRKIAELWLVAEDSAAEDLKKLCALLRGGWREKIKLYRRVRADDLNRQNDRMPNLDETLQQFSISSITELWNEKPRKMTRPAFLEFSETACKIVEQAPEAIDAARSRAGETVRFFGLPFLRVRRISGKEIVWFGVEGKRRRILDETSLPDFQTMFEDLLSVRRADAPNRKNYLFRAAPEGWLEAILRKDVSRLDPNLRLAPLHAQFRVSNKSGALDLLAIRADGRLAVIELKTAPDREMIFQAADYWRQIELQRRAGNLQKAGWFADFEISDAPALIYLVAPLMSFHGELDFLARAFSAEIEIWRFDLNEDWRHGIRVARRERIN